MVWGEWIGGWLQRRMQAYGWLSQHNLLDIYFLASLVILSR